MNKKRMQIRYSIMNYTNSNNNKINIMNKLNRIKINNNLNNN